MIEYVLAYYRVMTVESETELSQDELLHIAAEDLHDESGLWTVRINGGKRFVVPQPPAPAMVGREVAQDD